MDLRSAYTDFAKRNAVNPNVGYRIFLAAFAILILGFLTSNHWLPSATTPHQTTIGTQVDAGDGLTVTLDDCFLNPNTGELQVYFRIDDIPLQVQKFKLSARKNTAQTSLLESNVVFFGDGFLIAQIQTGTSNWDYISLWLAPDVPTEEASTASEELQGANILIDQRSVEKDNTLMQKSETDYRAHFVQKDIERNRQFIRDCEKIITQNTADIKLIEANIKQEQDNQKYQTEEEIRESNGGIATLYSEIASRKEDSESQKNLIKSYEEKIKKLEEKFADIAKEK